MKYQKYVDIINTGLKGETIEIELDKETINFFKDQSLLPFLYLVTKDNRLKSFYHSAFIMHEKLDQVAKQIDEILGNITHIFLKGYYLRNLYPNRIMRMMGDLDCLVDEERFAEAVELLKSAGFDYYKEDLHELSLLKDGIHIELHHHLIDNNIKDTALSSYKEHLSDNNQFEKEYELAYIVYHYAHHMEMAGAGIRPLIDIYLFLKKYDIDENQTIKYLETINLAQFYNRTKDLIDALFGNGQSSMSEKDVEQIFDYIVRSGVHGFASGNDYIGNMMAGQNNKSKLGFFMMKMFPSVGKLYTLYPKIKNKPLLVPFGYIYHFFTFPIKNRKKAMSSLKMDRNVIEESKEILEKMALK